MVRRPCVLVFDSIPGGANVAEFTSNVVIGYLQEEYAAKRGAAAAAATTTTTTTTTPPTSAAAADDDDAPNFRQRLKRISPVVPLQDGDVDCGLFLLQFAESFFTKPIPDFDEDFLRAARGEEGLTNWFKTQVIDEKRAKVKELILGLAAAAAKGESDS